MFAEVADLVGKDKASRLLSLTHSCSHTGQRRFRISVRTQCGVCFGCVVRKASFQASGIKDCTDYITAETGTQLETWLQRNNIDSSIRAFVQRGIRTRDIAVMGLPPSYPARHALDLCQRGLTELQGLFP